MEVPEIYDGTVVIESIARDPGDRAKVAVRSKEKDIDPVGACVGIKGSRVQAIIRELRGEKIDIVQWSDDPALFVANALNPAKVGRVTILEEESRSLEVTVEDTQLSQAIGKKGQNVRLASLLTGWRIEIKSESEKKKEIEEEMGRAAMAAQEIRSLPGVGEKMTASLLESGYRSLEQIVGATVDELCAVPGIGEKTANKIQEAAREAMAARVEPPLEAEGAGAPEGAGLDPGPPPGASFGAPPNEPAFTEAGALQEAPSPADED
jgi:N utilization substance protein A